MQRNGKRIHHRYLETKARWAKERNGKTGGRGHPRWELTDWGHVIGGKKGDAARRSMRGEPVASGPRGVAITIRKPLVFKYGFCIEKDMQAWSRPSGEGEGASLSRKSYYSTDEGQSTGGAAGRDRNALFDIG